MKTMIGLLVVSCLVIAGIGSRDAWRRKQCAACRRYSAARARKCYHCLEWLVLVLAVGVLAWIPESHAQRLVLVPCPGINFFGAACEDDIDGAGIPSIPVAATPLFSKDTMAADTPPLVIELLNHPTAEAAQRFLAWQAQRFQAMELAQRLLQQEVAARKQR